MLGVEQFVPQQTENWPEFPSKFTLIIIRPQIDTGQVAENFTIGGARDIITPTLNTFRNYAVQK